jgi:hypothetical protein
MGGKKVSFLVKFPVLCLYSTYIIAFQTLAELTNLEIKKKMPPHTKYKLNIMG